MSQLSAIMSSIAPKKTKKPKRKEQPTPEYVRLPLWKPRDMSDMQWEALVAQRQRWDDYRRGVIRQPPTPNRVSAPDSLLLWSPSAASNLYQSKVKSATTIQKWWRWWRRVRLFSQVLTLEEDFSSTSAVSPSWMFLRDQHIPADLRSYCDWHPTWERRVGKWRFHPPQRLFRTKDEEDYLLATLIWRNGVTRTPNSDDGEIIYHPVLKSFAITYDETPTQQQRWFIFSSFTELLRHVHVLEQLELRRIQRAIVAIQRAWKL